MTRPAILLTLASVFAACTEYDLRGETAPGDPPAEEEEETPPIGDGGENPVAKCAVEPEVVTPPFEEATFDGTESYDPEGRQLVDYKWTLVEAPQGSSIDFPAGDSPTRKLTPDLAGDYRAQLVVTTEDGRVSEPCEVVLGAVPTENLWIEMFWQYSGDDMDLHLLAPGGTMWSNKDCHWMNCAYGTGLDWGVQGNVADNPKLDLDDIAGTGPENINVQTPGAGTYTVVVDDYPGSQFPGGNDVTVNIYVDGSLKWTGTKRITGEEATSDGADNDVYFAKIDWPSGNVTGM
jgi:hypothetical protein